jgi:pimeloyl-ACP methyl ester carboxylesterase
VRVIAAAFAVLVALRLWSARILRRAEALLPPHASFVDVQGLRLHYVERGSGTPVVFIHGAKGSLQDWTLSVFDRAAQRWRAIAWDRPGCGHSQRPPRGGGSPLAQARVLRATLTKLDARRPVLVGHSLGAAVAMAYAVEFPDEVGAVVALAGYVLPVRTFHSPLARLLGVPLLGSLLSHTALPPLGKALAPAILRRAFYPDTVPPDYEKTAVAMALHTQRFAGGAEDLRTVDEALTQIAAQYPGLQVPLVAVVGMQDHILSPDQGRRLCRMVPGAELVELPRTGHLPHFTQPDPVLAAIGRACELRDGA